MTTTQVEYDRAVEKVPEKDPLCHYACPTCYPGPFVGVVVTFCGRRDLVDEADFAPDYPTICPACSEEWKKGYICPTCGGQS